MQLNEENGDVFKEFFGVGLGSLSKEQAEATIIERRAKLLDATNGYTQLALAKVLGLQIMIADVRSDTALRNAAAA